MLIARNDFGDDNAQAGRGGARRGEAGGQAESGSSQDQGGISLQAAAIALGRRGSAAAAARIEPLGPVLMHQHRGSRAGFDAEKRTCTHAPKHHLLGRSRCGGDCQSVHVSCSPLPPHKIPILREP